MENRIRIDLSPDEMEFIIASLRMYKIFGEVFNDPHVRAKCEELEIIFQLAVQWNQ